MDFIGVIAGASDPPGVDQQRWIDTISKHPALAPVAHGRDVGTMSWAQDDSNQIAVFGAAVLVAPTAHEIAALLGATFQPEPPEGA